MPRIPQIQIEQQYAAIGIRTTRSQMKISTPKPKMHVSQQRPQMQVERQSPQFRVNWKKVYADMGRLPAASHALEVRDYGRSVAHSAISEIAEDGSYLGNVVQRGNRVAELARQKSLRTSQVELNIGSVPSTSPEMEWDPGYLKVNWSNHELNIEWDRDFMPNIVIDPPYSVEIFLRNKPYIKISVVEDELPADVGKHVDSKR